MFWLRLVSRLSGSLKNSTPKECHMGLRPINGHERSPGPSFRAKRGICFFLRQRQIPRRSPQRPPRNDRMGGTEARSGSHSGTLSTNLWVRTLALFILANGISPVSVPNCQMVNPELLGRPWKAKWIASPEGPRREFGVFHFRKSFSLPSRPTHFIIHSSGDNRYELYVNGERVLVGPARGDLYNWRFETLDIASHLGAGKNVLAAVVWNFAESAPMAQMTNEAGFILQGDT